MRTTVTTTEIRNGQLAHRCVRPFSGRHLLSMFAGAGGVVATLTTLSAADVLVVNDGHFTRYEQAGALVVFGSEPIKLTTIPGTLKRAAPPSTEILKAILITAQRYAHDPAISKAGMNAAQWASLFQSNIEIESAYNPEARSHVGAIGLGQLMPSTASQLGVDPHILDQNLDGSARYLLAMLRRFGSPELALAAYNAGPNAVERHGGIPPFKETRGHVRKVMRVYNQILNI